MCASTPFASVCDRYYYTCQSDLARLPYMIPQGGENVWTGASSYISYPARCTRTMVVPEVGCCPSAGPKIRTGSNMAYSTSPSMICRLLLTESPVVSGVPLYSKNHYRHLSDRLGLCHSNTEDMSHWVQNTVQNTSTMFFSGLSICPWISSCSFSDDEMMICCLRSNTVVTVSYINHQGQAVPLRQMYFFRGVASALRNEHFFQSTLMVVRWTTHWNKMPWPMTGLTLCYMPFLLYSWLFTRFSS